MQLLDPEWVPDYGPAEFVSEWGATVTGARNFLIAYNINLLGTKEQAHRIALDLREIGRGPNEVCVCVLCAVYAFVVPIQVTLGGNTSSILFKGCPLFKAFNKNKITVCSLLRVFVFTSYLVKVEY